MTRDEALQKLRQLRPRLQAAYGVTRVGLFGSVARNQAHAGSDVDVIVQMPPTDLITFARLQQELQEVLKAPVDLLRDRPGISARLRKWLDREAVYAD
jgi:predicted nucleotidyltransferase